MATKNETAFIDELLRQDEAELRAKKKRLRTFAQALEELRRAAGEVAAAGLALLDSGDVSKSQAASVFDLSRFERSIAFARPSKSGVTEGIDQASNSNDDPANDANDQDADLTK